MIHIPKTSEIYTKIISILDKDHYTIDMREIENEHAVTCPFDNDMKCGKDEKGNIFIEKKTILSKPFQQA